VLRRRFEVLEAEDGPSALALAPDYRPNVVLMDLMMPGLDGVETLKRMRSTPWGPGMVAILMTARATENDGELSEHGFQAIIPKPFDPLSLDLRVEELLA